MLTSKRGLRTGAQAKVIRQLRGQGIQVEVSTLDVSLAQEAQQIVQLAEQQAPVAGIFHLAMVLTDKWIANQVLLHACCKASVADALFMQQVGWRSTEVL